MDSRIIYLDYNATTPLDPAVAEVMKETMQVFGNPSSLHPFGLEAKRILEQTRGRVSEFLGCHADEVVFTGGGTESNNLAIKGIAFASRGKGNHILTSSMEHPAVTEVCRYLETQGFRVTWLPVDGYGRVDPADVKKNITPKTILITVMHANNEVGTIQPVKDIGRIAREHSIPFHTDAAQSCGKIAVNVDNLRVDLLSLAGHKMYAPKGVGALYIRRGIHLEKLLHGADHERNIRPGTENLVSIAGLGMACTIATPLHAPSRLGRGVCEMLHDGIRDAIPEIRLNGHPTHRLPNTLSIGFPGIEAGRLLAEMKTIAASAGAACHADRTDVSSVLTAMKVPLKYALGTIRFSVGRMTTEEEIREAVKVVAGSYFKLTGSSQSAVSSWQSAVPGSQFPVSSQQFPVPSTQFPVSGHPLTSGIRLTEYSRSLGCACKIRPQALEAILRKFPVMKDPSVLVGTETCDDAAVYRIGKKKAIVQTVDFIPPVVDDPYHYGAIAAANALSDIYAMGGKPLFALNIVAFPEMLLPLEVLQQILRGAADKAKEAGIAIIGGHTVDDPEPKFGLVVTGIIDPDRILTNSGAMPGDSIVLTKPVGTGIITTALKRGIGSPGTVQKAIASMTELNRTAAEIMRKYPVSACTDVTGFGLTGHLKEVAIGSGVVAELFAKEIPVLPEVWELAAAGFIPGGTENNLSYCSDKVKWDPSLPELAKKILSDAQTSGGLLIFLPEESAMKMVAKMRQRGIVSARIIGKIKKGRPAIQVRDIIA